MLDSPLGGTSTGFLLFLLKNIVIMVLYGIVKPFT